MIEPISGLPDGVVGMRAVGRFTVDDYVATIEPALEEFEVAHRPLRLLFHLGPQFTGFGEGAGVDLTKELRATPFHRVRSSPTPPPSAPACRCCASRSTATSAASATTTPTRPRGGSRPDRGHPSANGQPTVERRAPARGHGGDAAGVDGPHDVELGDSLREEHELGRPIDLGDIGRRRQRLDEVDADDVVGEERQRRVAGEGHAGGENVV